MRGAHHEAEGKGVKSAAHCIVEPPLPGPQLDYSHHGAKSGVHASEDLHHLGLEARVAATDAHVAGNACKEHTT